MIAVDSSVVVAIAAKEPEGNIFTEIIASEDCVIGWPTVLECHMVLVGVPRGRGLAVLNKVLAAPQLITIAFGREEFAAAAAAFDNFGKGRHRAKLNFGDCMAYAVAKTRNVPLLYKGTDFNLTDIRTALP